MRIAYFDLISGLSGDMTAGALVHLGLPRQTLTRELAKLRGLKFRLQIGRKLVHGIQATRFRVQLNGRAEERSWKEIQRLIKGSTLGSRVKERGLHIFETLAKAEGKIHGVPPDKVHFHEVGAVDSIVDILTAAIGTDYLKIDDFVFSRVPLGRGVTKSRHGSLPVPAPATLELLKGCPVQGTPLDSEIVTPTGAAIIRALAGRFGDLPPMTVEKVGYGAGEKEFPDRPNLVRVLLGRKMEPWGQDEMLVMESNIDDMNPEIYDYLLERLFALGARDVSLVPIQMKKNRPGILLRIITKPSLREKLAETVFTETSTIGIRYYPVGRMVLHRWSQPVKTKFGTIQAKVIERPGIGPRATPEYEELKKLAQKKGIPLKTLYEEVLKAFKGN